jgi:hypothetical protein
MPVYDAANYPLIGGFSKVITTTAMQGGVKVSSITGYTGAVSEALDIVDIVYQRPSPSITFIGRRVSGGVWVKTYTRIDITLSANDGSTKTISVRLSGQVSLQ